MNNKDHALATPDLTRLGFEDWLCTAMPNVVWFDHAHPLPTPDHMRYRLAEYSAAANTLYINGFFGRIGDVVDSLMAEFCDHVAPIAAVIALRGDHESDVRREVEIALCEKVVAMNTAMSWLAWSDAAYNDALSSVVLTYTLIWSGIIDRVRTRSALVAHGQPAAPHAQLLREMQHEVWAAWTMTSTAPNAR